MRLFCRHACGWHLSMNRRPWLFCRHCLRLASVDGSTALAVFCRHCLWLASVYELTPRFRP
jgi:hypothetical protein